MKTCPYCADEIQDAAIVCKHCGRELTQKSESSQSRTSGQSAAVGCGVILLIVMGSCLFLLPTDNPSPTRSTDDSTISTAAPESPAPAPVPASPDLALLAARGYEESGFHQVEGQVQNISSNSLDNVTVIVTWYTSDSEFITSDEALIDFNPILPGQISNFSTLTRSNPAMSRFSVQFKDLLAGTIQHEDRR